MKKIIMILSVLIATMFVNTASAMTEVEVQKYVLDTVPGATEFDAGMCAHVYVNGGTYMTKSFDVTLECGKHSLVKDWDLPSN